MSVGGSEFGLFVLRKRCQSIGTTFWFEIPFKTLIVTPDRILIDHLSTKIGNSMKPLSILILDDTLVVLRFLSKTLSDAGH